MDIKKRDFLLGGASVWRPRLPQHRRPRRKAPRRGASARPIQVGDRNLVNSHVQPSSVDLNYKPRRVNKAIELWEDGQPIYYGFSGMGPGVDPYAQGVKMARTYLDAINIELEHGALDFSQLREFMRGLVDGGPTRIGPSHAGGVRGDLHHRPGRSLYARQQLGAGAAPGLRHARHPYVPCPRYQGGAGGDPDGLPLSLRPARHPQAADAGPARLIRRLCGADAGAWSCTSTITSPICGRSIPKGELIFGVKIEDTFADQQAETTIALPGIAMAEWGPGDHSYWLDGLSIMEDNSILGDITRLATRPEMVKVGENVRATVQEV